MSALIEVLAFLAPHVGPLSSVVSASSHDLWMLVRDHGLVLLQVISVVMSILGTGIAAATWLEPRMDPLQKPIQMPSVPAPLVPAVPGHPAVLAVAAVPQDTLARAGAASPDRARSAAVAHAAVPVSRANPQPAPPTQLSAAARLAPPRAPATRNAPRAQRHPALAGASSARAERRPAPAAPDDVARRQPEGRPDALQPEPAGRVQWAPGFTP